MSSVTPTTVAVVGGPLVAGHGDGRGLGWVGRVTARTLPSLPDLRVFPLAVPHEDSSGLHARTIAEASLRFTSDGDNRLVLALGSGDLDSGRSVARARLDVANVLDEALARKVSAFVIGPPRSTTPTETAGSLNSTRASQMSQNDGASPMSIRSPRCWVIQCGSVRSHPRETIFRLRKATVSSRGWCCTVVGSHGWESRTPWAIPEHRRVVTLCPGTVVMKE